MDESSGSAPASHEALAVVLQVRDGRLQVLLWQRAREPFNGAWALPGGLLGPSETLETRSAPARHPRRMIPPASLGLVPTHHDPAVPADTSWHPVNALPELAFDHGAVVLAGRERLRAKLSYTNIGFALAPPRFTISELRTVYRAALGHDVSATNLQRVLLRRGVLEPTGESRAPGQAGGPPAALVRVPGASHGVTRP